MADHPAASLSRPLPEPSVSSRVRSTSESDPAAGLRPDVRLQAPVLLREIIAVVLLVILADLTIYRGEGYTGFAALFAAISSEGILALHPLLQSRDEAIREGIRAMFAERTDQVKQQERENPGWTAFQLADRLLLRQLEASRSEWQLYTDRGKRAEALERFHQYAYQWY